MPAAARLRTARVRVQAAVRALRERHGWLDHLFRAGARYVEQRGNHFAAAVTFFSVLTAVPLLMVAFAAAGYVLWFRPTLLARLEQAIAVALPGALSEALVPIVETAVAQRNTVAAVGLAGALWSGVWWMSNLREAVSAQWRLPAPNPAALRRLLHDLAALVGLGAALVASLAVTAVGSGLAATVLALVGAADDGAGRAALRVSTVLVGLLANWLIFSWVILRLPRTDVPLRRGARAALLGAVGLEVLKQGAALFLDRVSTSASGAVFGSLLGLLLFSYLVARLVLFVTAWAATAEDAPARAGRPDLLPAGRWRAIDAPGTVPGRGPTSAGGPMPETSPYPGAVEWVALTFPGPRLDPAVAGPLRDLVAAGTVRLLDAVVVHKAADGTVTEAELEDEAGAALDAVDGEVLELLSHDDLLGLALRLEPDTTTLALVWENRWSAALAEAVRRHGGRVLAHDRVPAADVECALRAAAGVPDGAVADGARA